MDGAKISAKRLTELVEVLRELQSTGDLDAFMDEIYEYLKPTTLYKHTIAVEYSTSGDVDSMIIITNKNTPYQSLAEIENDIAHGLVVSASYMFFNDEGFGYYRPGIIFEPETGEWLIPNASSTTHGTLIRNGQLTFQDDVVTEY